MFFLLFLSSSFLSIQFIFYATIFLAEHSKLNKRSKRNERNARFSSLFLAHRCRYCINGRCTKEIYACTENTRARKRNKWNKSAKKRSEKKKKSFCDTQNISRKLKMNIFILVYIDYFISFGCAFLKLLFLVFFSARLSWLCSIDCFTAQNVSWALLFQSHTYSTSLSVKVIVSLFVKKKKAKKTQRERETR